MATDQQVKDSIWKQFGFTGTDTSQFINQFATNLGFDKFEDNDAFHRQIFAKFDRDGNGTINEEELGQIINQCGFAIDRSQVGQMLKEIDQNADGKLEFSEFLRLIRKIQSGNMAYVGVTTAERGPGNPNPPAVDPNLLTPVGQNINGMSAFNNGQFEQLINQLKNHDGSMGGLSFQEDINGALSGSQSQIEAALRQKLAGISGQYNGLQGQFNALLTDRNSLAEQKNKLLEMLAQYRQNESILRTQVQQIPQKDLIIADLTAQFNKAKKYIGEVNVKVKQQEIIINERDVEIKRLLAIIETQTREINGLKATVQQQQTVIVELQPYKAKWERAEQTIVALNEEIRGLRSTVQQQQQTIIELQPFRAKWERAEQTILALNEEIRGLRLTVESQQKTIIELQPFRAKWERAEQTILVLQEEIRGLRVTLQQLQVQIGKLSLIAARYSLLYDDLKIQFSAFGGQFANFRSQCEGLLANFLSSQNAFRTQLESFSKGIPGQVSFNERQFTQVELDKRVADIMADLNQVREIQNALNVGIAAGVKQIYDKKQSREIVIKNVMSAGNFNQAQATKLVEQGGMFENKWKGTSSNGTHLSHEELKIVIQHLVTQVQSGKVDLNNL